MVEEGEAGRSIAETPTWAFAAVVAALVCLGFLIHGGLNKIAMWLDRTKRKPQLAALVKIREELMVFGLLSLLMGHWIGFVARICIKSSAINAHFYPCSPWNHPLSSSSPPLNMSLPHSTKHSCPQGHESFASKESLEELHQFLFVLGVTHVSYSFLAVALAMFKISSWRRWENHANSMALQGLGGSFSSEAASYHTKMRRLSTFILHQTSHPWSHHRVLVWLTHQLPLMYDFHKYMLRSMEAEFCHIVGISIHLWIFAISCILLSFHGTNLYFWISFVPTLGGFSDLV